MRSTMAYSSIRGLKHLAIQTRQTSQVGWSGSILYGTSLQTQGMLTYAYIFEEYHIPHAYQPQVRFEEASSLTGSEFTSRLRYYSTAWLPARATVLDAVNARFVDHPSGRIVLLDQFVPWKVGPFDNLNEGN